MISPAFPYGGDTIASIPSISRTIVSGVNRLRRRGNTLPEDLPDTPDAAIRQSHRVRFAHGHFFLTMAAPPV